MGNEQASGIERQAFQLLPCDACGRRVLPYIRLSDYGDLERRCLHCDGPVHESDGGLRFSYVEVLEMGYDDVPISERIKPRWCGSDEGGSCGTACSSRKKR
jgi:hypothetical protein